MRENLRGTLWRLAIYVTCCSFFVFAVFAVFGNIRLGQRSTTYAATFANVSGLKEGDFVRIAGVEVGKVQRIDFNNENSTLRVEFEASDTVVLTEGTRAAIRYKDLIGGRFLGLEEGAGATPKLQAGATIPISQTAPALDLETLVGGFRPLFRALVPDKVNALTGQLITAFQGQGATISSF